MILYGHDQVYKSLIAIAGHRTARDKPRRFTRLSLSCGPLVSSPGLLFLLLLWLSGRCWARLAFPRCDRLPRSKGYELTPAGANFNTILHSVLQVGRKQGVSKATHTHTHAQSQTHGWGPLLYKGHGVCYTCSLDEPGQML